MTEYLYAVDQSLLPAGKALYEKVKCLTCHYVGTETPGAKAPDLAGVRSRLRPDWVGHWLARPDSIVPGTPMTAFWWMGGKPASPAPEILGGDVQMQIKAVQDFIYSLGRVGIPSPTPYSTIGGSPRYVLPNGSYQASASTNAMKLAGDTIAERISGKHSGETASR
jgi:hypothetical protein